MVQAIELDRPLQKGLGGSVWLDRDWMLHDIDAFIRHLYASYATVHSAKGNPPVHLEPMPYPSSGLPEVDEEQAAIEAELLAVVHRKE